MKKFLFLFSLLFIILFNAQEKKLNDIQKILSGIIKEKHLKPNSDNIFIIRFSHIPNEKNILADLVYFDKTMAFGWNEEDKNWGIYNFKGFEIFIISEKTIDILNPLKKFRKISDEKFQNENRDEIYDPKEWKFYVNQKLEFVKPFFNFTTEILRKEKLYYKKLMKK